ncbi:MAG: ferric reductase-like transmembrane domain-containing protein [Chloroflexi bacterium]|uniref:Ferric reductase-like transmembrane domain-containing protein n=1 Tax=Candidatus Chlorohelix allophototropha TaxID=3003348 RepID=A0A8T7M4R7_9CHLR|nr:ferric reductase-like transmembrane domain-containing protein [Chloroflexota bacterium]WJW69994.1 ferric reductase-like transmembrane domain-containing protein [Chloroflexota bacterium L227-S17]
MLASSKIQNISANSNPRLKTHAVMTGITFVGCLIAAIFASPAQSILETLSVGTGYIGLLLIMATLLIGPINMLKVRKNPVNINLRRDVGIWAGITSLAHVFFAAALQLSWGSSLLGFFFNTDGAFKFNLFGISSVFGLIGTLVILLLLVISNNLFLKKLKGKNWKTMQRLNYLLFVVALAHTFTQQVNIGRNALLIFGVMALTAGVVLAQSIGAWVYRQRAQQRKVTTEAVVASKAVGARRASVELASGKTRKYNVVSRNSFAKVISSVGVGALVLFMGFMIAKEGTQVINSINNTANSNGYVTNSNGSTSSSSSSGVQVNSAAVSQPQVVSRHS